MNWGKLTRKLSLLALAAGVTISTIPGAAYGASSGQPRLTKSIVAQLQDSSVTYISPQLDTTSTEDVRVIVQLTGQPAAVGKYAAKQGISALAAVSTERAVNSQQTNVLTQADEAGLDIEVNYKYNTVLNGFEITIPANEIPELSRISGVKSIYKNSTWYPIPVEEETAAVQGEVVPQNDNAPLKQIGADWAWEHDYTGKGLKVGVIDTGIDYTHPDIAAAYKGGYDSFYKDNDPYEEYPDPSKKFAGTSHGTHVSGTIIGQFANKKGEIAQKGVAPGADLYVYKVLGYNPANPSTASGSSAQVIDGIERAVKDHMDVINLSLGSDEEKDVNSPDAIAINNAVLSGIVAVIANGNAGPGGYTLGSPATSQLGISVGAITSPSKQFSGQFKPEVAGDSVTTATYSTYGEFQVMAWELGKENFTDIVGTKPVDVVYAALGSEADFEKAGNVEDAIVLLSRGQLAFTEKIANAKAHKAKAIVIFNGIGTVDEEGNSDVDLRESISGRDGFINSSLGDGFENIPTFDLKGTEGRALARAFTDNPDIKLQFTFGTDYNPKFTEGDELASFTSEGPNVDSNLSIKPDVTAPGVGVLSTIPAYGQKDASISYEKAYTRENGTSMAAPHVAGLALLVKQAHPTWSPFDIRAALANTAKVAGDADGNPYTVYEQGAGRVNVEGAITTNVLLQSIEPITILDKNYTPQTAINYNSSAAFGVVAPGNSAVKNLQLKNTGGEALTYDASVAWHYGTPEGITAALDRDSVTADAGKTTPFLLNLTVGANAAEGFYEGQINVSAAGQPALHLPFTVYVGKALPDSGLGIQELTLTHALIYPNRTLQNSTDLTFRVVADNLNYIETDIFNLNDELVGFLDIQSTDGSEHFFKPGQYSVKGIKGEYHPYNKDGAPILDAKGEPIVEHLKDGTYKINLLAAQITAEGKVAQDETGKDVLFKAYTSIRIDNSLESSGGSGGSGGGAAAPTTTATPAASAPVSSSIASVIEQGLKQVTVPAVVSSNGGVSVLSVSDQALKTAVDSAAGSSAAVIISAPATTDAAVKVNFTADQVKLLAGLAAKSTIVFNASGSALSLPVSLLSNATAGASLDLILKKAEDQASKFTNGTTGASVIGTPISFEANWTTASGSKALEIPNDVFIKRSFTVPGAIAANTAGVLFEANGKITPVASLFKPQADGSTIVTVSRPGFSVYAAVSRPVTFTDIASSPAATDIQALANKLIIEGTSATTFSPKSNLTRAEFTALLSRSLGLRTSSASNFTDVKAADWYASDVAAAYEAGLILGTGAGKFSPAAKVTRQELAVILDRALKLTGVELKAANPSFTAYTDAAKIAPYAKESVQTLSAAGVISSDAGANFNPSAAATRETVAVVLRQLLRKANLID